MTWSNPWTMVDIAAQWSREERRGETIRRVTCTVGTSRRLCETRIPHSVQTVQFTVTTMITMNLPAGQALSRCVGAFVHDISVDMIMHQKTSMDMVNVVEDIWFSRLVIEHRQERWMERASCSSCSLLLSVGLIASRGIIDEHCACNLSVSHLIC